MQTGKNIFLVTGDPARNKELCLPGGGSATIRIVLPAAWNTLMAERGYAPLDSYKLTSDPTHRDRRCAATRVEGSDIIGLFGHKCGSLQAA